MNGSMRRKAKLLAALLVVAGACILILWNTSAQSVPPALGVSDAKYQAASLEGRDVTVRGNVVEGTIVEANGKIVSFVVADAHEQLHVAYNQTPPENFGSKEVVAKGRLVIGPDGVVVLHAESIQVGCASKY